MNSVKKTCRSSSKSKCNGIENLTSKGFQYSCRITNNGDCVKVFGEVVAKDGRGSCGGSVSWAESRNEKKLVTVDGQAGGILWGEDISFELPDNVKAFELKVTQSLDPSKQTTMIIEGTEESQDWFSVSANLDVGTIILSPRAVEEALR